MEKVDCTSCVLLKIHFISDITVVHICLQSDNYWAKIILNEYLLSFFLNLDNS